MEASKGNGIKYMKVRKYLAFMYVVNPNKLIS